jgi:hypothetical protein
MNRLARWAALTTTALTLLGLGGCTTTSLLLGAAGVASDTSMTWEIVKHVHGKLTEGDPTPCGALDSVERALSPRCGEFVRGSLRARDLASSPFGACALTTAARDKRLWPALPELLDNGARPQTCAQSPIVALAQANDCPSLAATPTDVRDALTTLAQIDPRAVHHDVVRWLSCPASREAGLDATLLTWLDTGALEPGTLSFSALSALHPSDIGSPFALALEAHGHTADAALDGYRGERASGFEEALRTSDWAALEWWIARLPQLANRVPSQQLGWVPLARVLTPGFLAYPASQADMVGFLLARGADPRARLPANPSQSVLAMAQAMKSPLLGTLEAAASQEPTVPANVLASSNRALKLMAR